MTVRAFTGPSTLTEDQKRFVQDQVAELPHVDEVRTGGAHGVDTEAALVSVRWLQDATRHVLYLPNADFNERVLALGFLPNVAIVRVPGGPERSAAYRARNRAMVDGATELVAFVREPEFYRSGEWMTINLARKAGIPVIVIELPKEAEMTEDQIMEQVADSGMSELSKTPVIARKGWAHPHLPNEGKTSEWYTPAHVFEAIGLTFDLDPCAPPGGVPWVPATEHYSRTDDGLNQDWHGRVWLNPPYGKEAGQWVEKLAEHGNGIALVFSRTDVVWWHNAVPHATAVCFIRGRLTFIAGSGQSAPGNSGGPSALIAYGDECAEAIERSGLGLTYRTTNAP